MRRLLPLIIIAIAIVFSSCKETANEGLRIAVSQEPVTLDVMVNTSLSGRIIAVGNIYEKLLVLDSEGRIRPELCSSYTLSEDGRRLEFRLRDALFHNGEHMRAEDAAASMNRWLSKCSAARDIAGDSSFEYSDGVLHIESSSSLALLPYLIASAPQSAVIIPESSVLSEGEDGLIRDAIGTGPYRLSSWSAGESIVLEKAEGYMKSSSSSDGIWGEKNAYIERLEYFFVPDSVTRRLGLESGLYDFINDVMSDDLPSFLSDDRISVHQGGESGSIALVFNKKEGPGSDPDFRKAVSLALDKESLMKACYGETGYSIHSDYMEKEQSIWKTDASDPYADKDIEKARRYLAASSYDGRKFRILTSNLSNLDKIAVAMASELEEIGIACDIIAVDWATMMEKRKDSSSYDLFISAFSSVVLPQMKLYLSPSYPGFFSNAEIESDIVRMGESMTIEEASGKWKSIQEELWEYIPAIIPGHYITVYASSSSVEGIIIQDGFYFWNARKVR